MLGLGWRFCSVSQNRAGDPQSLVSSIWRCPVNSLLKSMENPQRHRKAKVGKSLPGAGNSFLVQSKSFPRGADFAAPALEQLLTTSARQERAPGARREHARSTPGARQEYARTHARTHTRRHARRHAGRHARRHARRRTRSTPGARQVRARSAPGARQEGARQERARKQRARSAPGARQERARSAPGARQERARSATQSYYKNKSNFENKFFLVKCIQLKGMDQKCVGPSSEPYKVVF